MAGRSTGAAAGPGAVLMSRIDNELSAIGCGSERATEKILAAAEEIQTAAANLAAALHDTGARAQAEDIQDLVVQIYEACNFQDLLGQRIAKIAATVKFIDKQMGSVLRTVQQKQPQSGGRPCVHGTRLDDDHGHATQDEVDALFATAVPA